MFFVTTKGVLFNPVQTQPQQDSFFLQTLGENPDPQKCITAFYFLLTSRFAPVLIDGWDDLLGRKLKAIKDFEALQNYIKVFFAISPS